MHKLLLASALLSCAAFAHAQCQSSPGPGSLRTPFAGQWYYTTGGGAGAYPAYCLYVDIQCHTAITVTGAATLTWDDGGGSPNQVGNIADVNFYTCATSVIGNELSYPPYAMGASGAAHPNQAMAGAPGAPWTLAGQGTLTVVPWAQDAVVTLVAPFNLPMGSTGLCMEILAPDPTVNVGNPNVANCGPLSVVFSSQTANSTFASNPLFAYTYYAIQGDAFLSNAATEDINFGLDYAPANPNTAWTETYGNGCYDDPFAFYDALDNSTPVPYSTISGFTLLPGAQGVSGAPAYTVLPALAAWVQPGTDPNTTVHDLLVNFPTPTFSNGSWDDSGENITFPGNATFSYLGDGGVPTNTVGITSNGRLMLEPLTGAGQCWGFYNDVDGFKNDIASICPFWGDLDPTNATAPGHIYYEEDTVNNAFFRVTWDGVPEWTSGTPIPNFVQVTLHFATGQIDVAYGPGGLAITSAPVLVGYSPGDGRLGAEKDLEALLTNAPFSFTSGDGTIPPRLAMDVIPVWNAPATPNVVLSDIPASALMATTILDLAYSPSGYQLDPYGIPGCTQYVGSTAGQYLVHTGIAISPGAQLTVPLPPINNTFVIGLVLQYQGLIATSAPYVYNGTPNRAFGTNFSLLTSNAVCGLIGN